MRKLTLEEVQKRLPENCNILEDYKGLNVNHKFTCPICYNIFVTKPEHIFTGHTKSCGCINIKRRTGVGELSGSFYSKIVTQARHRDIEFNISKEYIYSILLSQNFKCAISGMPIEIGYKNGEDRRNITASLDRIDSSKGYIEGNVQWVHKKINMMKGILSNEEFLGLCKIVTETSLRKLN